MYDPDQNRKENDNKITCIFISVHLRSTVRSQYSFICVCVYRIRNNDIKYAIIKYSPSNVIVPYDTVARTEERTQCKWNNFIINFSIYISFCKIRLIYYYCLNVGSTQCNNSHIYFIYLVKVVIAFYDMLNCVFCINIAINFIVNSGLPECMYMTDKRDYKCGSMYGDGFRNNLLKLISVNFSNRHWIMTYAYRACLWLRTQ